MKHAALITALLSVGVISGFIGWHLCKYDFYYRYYNDTQKAAIGILGDDE